VESNRDADFNVLIVRLQTTDDSVFLYDLCMFNTYITHVTHITVMNTVCDVMHLYMGMYNIVYIIM
jgi:hypothetical protein